MVMTVLMFLIALVCFTALILVAAISPKRSRFSQFELERRKSAVHGVEIDVRREALYADIISIQRVLQAVLLVAFVLLVVAAFGWLTGGLLAIVVSLQYGTISSISHVRRLAAAIYDKYELVVLSRIERHQPIVRWLRSAVPVSQRRTLDSREELEHLVSDSQAIISDDEKKLILGSLTFASRQVAEIMTPKSVVETVKRSEMLGPLVLDDLHKTGHSRFPVIDEDIDHIVGILYVRDVLTLDTNKKHTAKVETAMSKRVYYIRDDHTLEQALTAFLSTHHHLFIVINEFRETVGILTLEDTLEALLGRRIIDEFDAHDDMRAVAARNATKKSAINRSTDSKDI